MAPSLGSLRKVTDSKALDTVNVASLLAQGANALRNGNKRDAALLLGAATIATRYRGLSYLVQGGVTVNNLRKRIT